VDGSQLLAINQCAFRNVRLRKRETVEGLWGVRENKKRRRELGKTARAKAERYTR
jgi:hypothetical protein